LDLIKNEKGDPTIVVIKIQTKATVGIVLTHCIFRRIMLLFLMHFQREKYSQNSVGVYRGQKPIWRPNSDPKHHEIIQIYT